jgi:L-asparaginase II
VAEVVRSGFVEGRHRGSLVVLDPAGSVRLGRGDVLAPMFPRSSNKLMQAAGMVSAGLALTGEHLALAAASHSGESFHVAAVAEILAGAGLDESALQTPPDLPYGEAAREAALRRGDLPSRIAMNCSGKHAAMLATCVANGWSLPDYLDRSHPVQQATRDAVERLTGEPAGAVGTDGCGAPVLAVSLLGLARAFGRSVLAAPEAPERRVADAMRAWPAYVAGTGRDVTDLMVAVPGLLAKDGAEGVFACALPDGTSFAVKVEDGADRARQVVAAAVLSWLGVPAPVLDRLATIPLLGGGRVVGEIRVAPGLLPT